MTTLKAGIFVSENSAYTTSARKTNIRLLDFRK